MEKRVSNKKIAAIAIALEAQLRIPWEYGHLTYFSRNDTWVYHGIFDEVFCPLCQNAAVPFTYAGSSLRRIFPFLNIVGADKIEARVHMPRDDNCRCWLSRSVASDKVLDKQEKRFDKRLDKVSDSDAFIDRTVAKFRRGRRKRKKAKQE